MALKRLKNEQRETYDCVRVKELVPSKLREPCRNTRHMHLAFTPFWCPTIRGATGFLSSPPCHRYLCFVWDMVARVRNIPYPVHCQGCERVKREASTRQQGTQRIQMEHFAQQMNAVRTVAIRSHLTQLTRCIDLFSDTDKNKTRFFHSEFCAMALTGCCLRCLTRGARAHRL